MYIEPYLNDSLNEKANTMIIENSIRNKVVHFVVPLAARMEIFLRFMRNYEDTCLKSGENTKLVVVLFENSQSEKVNGNMRQSELILSLFAKLSQKYQLDSNAVELDLIVNEGTFREWKVF